ncbi:MAG: hypothetical protein WCJ49_05555, partial [Deltaproteobacteria bacterium]
MTREQFLEECCYLKTLSLSASKKIGVPLFYVDKADEIRLSEDIFNNNEVTQRAITIIGDMSLAHGHGVTHARKVAIDAGAIVIAELSHIEENELFKMVDYAHFAGVFHDIARKKNNHAHIGAQEAERLLIMLGIDSAGVFAIKNAIANHEAFQKQITRMQEYEQLLSDALYDADKLTPDVNNGHEKFMLHPF